MKIFSFVCMLFVSVVTSAPSLTCHPQYSHGRAWCSPVYPPPPSQNFNRSNVTSPAVAQGLETASSITSLLNDVVGATNKRYNIQDSTGQQMASLHVLDSQSSDGQYVGLYMAFIDQTWEVRVATSSDLMTWQYVRSIIANADMPYARTLSNGWIIVAHEQWMSDHSQVPSRLGFKLYYTVADLIQGTHFNSYTAPLTVGTQSSIEGTPSFWDATLVKRNGYYMVDAKVRFHFNDDRGIDQVGSGSLTSFGPSVVDPQWSDTTDDTGYNQAFVAQGAIGNIGQRSSGDLAGTMFILQEGNVGKMPPTIWQDWRVWLYLPGGEAFPPSGAGQIQMLKPITDKGSTAFGNPSVQLVNCPGSALTSNNVTLTGSCAFVSYFIFSEGAAPGEAGPVAFYHPV